MTKLNSCRFFGLLALLLALAGCGSGSAPPAQPHPVAITVTPANAAISPGGSQQFGAVATYSDGSKKDVTSLASWTTSLVATIDSAGLASAASSGALGVTAVTATWGGLSGSATLTVTNGSVTPKNVMALSVNGEFCSDATSAGYFNKPCVSVTICEPGGSNCTTVNDILLDTGSYGLRLFKQAVPGLSLPAAASGGGTLGECAQFGDGSALWGPVTTATVQMGSSSPVQVPIQLVDATFASVPSSCGTVRKDPVDAGFAGILGVGTFVQDCGAFCAGQKNNGFYFSCVGSSCSGTTVPLSKQVLNPAAQLPQDSNGLLVQLPAVPQGGLTSLGGSVIFGVGTQTNNAPAASTVLPLDASGYFTTTLNGSSSATSFLDTGSNALYFPSSIARCGGAYSDWYCPPGTTSLTAQLSSGSASAAVSFSVSNFNTLYGGTSNNVFSDVAGNMGSAFDWGLPFYMGRNVYLGFEGKSSLLGSGSYVAY